MPTTTPNFGWSVPVSTDLVKDGALNIETLGDAIDGRFGDVATYPSQIVNRVSGVSRPLPYAMSAGFLSLTGTATITLPAGRFTQSPLINATILSSSGTAGTSVTFGTVGTTSFTLVVWTGTTVSTTARTAHWTALQMTSAAASG